MGVKMKISKNRFFAATLILFFLTCWSWIQAASEEWPTLGWKTSTPEEQGVDSMKLAEVMDELLNSNLRVHSVLVVRNGHIVLEANFYPFQPNGLHDLASVTKAITATIIGIAINKRFIQDVHQPILDFFPDYKIKNVDERKKSMLLEHLLSMRDGIQCIASPSEITLMQMLFSPNFVQFMLDLPMEAEPGTRYRYNSGGVHLLSAVVSQATGQGTLEFAKKYLFGPLGISDMIWPVDPQGVNNYGWGDLRLRARDLAKIGYLYLKNGLWQGNKILPEGWMAQATKKYTQFDDGNGYGYQFDIHTDGSYSKSGRGGQFLHVIPARNMVVVIYGIGGLPRLGGILNKLVQSANETGDPLTPNPKSNAVLKEKIEHAAKEPEAVPEIFPLPEIAKQISGKVYNMEPNQLGLTKLSVVFHNAREAVLKYDLPPMFSDRQAELRVGLDGIPRIGAGRYGLPEAATGRWSFASSLVVDIDGIGNNLDIEMVLNFEENRISGTVTGSVFDKIPIRGSF